MHRKRDDAVALLRRSRDDLRRASSRLARTWTLQHTRYWEDARRSVELAAEHRARSTPAVTADEELEAVLRRGAPRPRPVPPARRPSLLIALARNARSAVGVDVSSWAHQAASTGAPPRGLLRTRRRRQLVGAARPERADLPAVARRLAVLRWAHDAHRDSVAGELALTVRSDEVYTQLAARAARKRDGPRIAAASRRPTSTAAVISLVLPASSSARRSPWRWTPGRRRTAGGRMADLLRAIRAEWRFQQATGSGKGRPPPQAWRGIIPLQQREV